MKEKKLLLMFALLAGSLVGGGGCGDPNRPPEDPFLRPPPTVLDQSKPAPKLLTRDEMLEAYHFILESRETLLVLADHVAHFKGQDEDAFIAQRNIFNIKQDELKKMTTVRQDNFQRSLRSDRSHYARDVMVRALRKFNDLIDAYWTHFVRGDPVDPEIDKELLNLLEQANYHLEHYRDPEPAEK